MYEWENGVVYLISTGQCPLDSHLMDSSENGDDVFFATAEGLGPGDTDGGYDVYDARVPHPGEPFPPAAVPCEGSVCQGPPHVESPLAPPARATLPRSDNVTPEPSAPPVKPKALTRAQKLTKALESCRAKKSKKARRRCEREAHGKYGPKTSAKRATKDRRTSR